MTAVVCSLGPIQRVTDSAGVVADAIVTAVSAGPLPHLDDLSVAHAPSFDGLMPLTRAP